MHFSRSALDTRQLAVEPLRPVGALGHPLLGIFEQLDAFLPLGEDTRQLALEQPDVLLALAKKVRRGRQIDEGRRAVQRLLRADRQKEVRFVRSLVLRS